MLGLPTNKPNDKAREIFLSEQLSPETCIVGRDPVDQESPLEALRAINWDFPERTKHSEIEGLHPYPAKFVSELPRALLEGLPVPAGSAVLDPFCGSGTTLIECQKLGLNSVGIDLNPIACLMSRVKTSLAPTNLIEAAERTVECAQSISAPKIPNIPNLDHWFQSTIQLKLSALTEAISIADPVHLDALRLAVSSIIVRVSNQESDTRYAAVKKKVTADDVYPLFMRSVERINSTLQSRQYDLSTTTVLEADILKVSANQIPAPIGLVITSPPYPNAYEYWLYHKYRMWWLGFDPLAVKQSEIGARAHFFRKNHHTAEDFVRQMTSTFDLFSEVVIPGGYVCFVVGRSKIHGEIVDNSKIIEDVGALAGFETQFIENRVVAASRKSFNLSHANIKQETVLVLRKETV